MRPETIHPLGLPNRAALPAHWQGPLLQVAAAWVALIAAFAGDWAAMFDQWWNISTYNHVLLVIPIIGWLIAQRRVQLADLKPRPWRWGLAALGGAVLVWVLGSFAGLNLLRQTGAVAMLPAAALLLLGPRIVAALLFPFAYMAFLVPFGDELVPPLQTITAKTTVALVHLTNIPAQIDGVFIDTPAGLFEVAEACSGVKFLIAMVALGVLVGNVCFKSWRRRMAFLALCIVVPILANGVRAWGTIFAAQFVGAEKAAGIDHIVYGWVFFAVVIAAVMALGWRYFDRDPGEPLFNVERVRSAPMFDRLERQGIAASLALALAALTVLAGIAWSTAADALEASMPRQIVLPEVAGWQRVGYEPLAPWQPRASGAAHRLLGRYRDRAGNEVDVFFALYPAQGEGREAGGFGEGALTPKSGWSWTSNGPAIGGAKSDRLVSGGSVERVALTWYRTGTMLSGSNLDLKAANMADRLLLRPRPTAMLILSSESRPGFDAAAALQQFVRAIGDPGPWMDRIGEQR